VSDKRDPRRALGAAGEARAAAFLETQGYRILARKVRAGGVEIDLVAARGRRVVFVEVKSRSSPSAFAAEEAVDFRKRARLVRGAAAWLAQQPRHARAVRFDVITCRRAADESWELTHLPGAFEAGD
jgi:putative endonuclease